MPCKNPQPADAVREEGQTVAFTVGVSGIGARYQWFKTGITIPGATQSSFIIVRQAGP